MRKVYCDRCLKHIVTQSKKQLKIYDSIEEDEFGDSITVESKIFELFMINLDLCDECESELSQGLKKIEIELTEQKVRETTSDNKDVKEKSPDNE